jgi:hypothetical protein
LYEDVYKENLDAEKCVSLPPLFIIALSLTVAFHYAKNLFCIKMQVQFF